MCGVVLCFFVMWVFFFFFVYDLQHQDTVVYGGWHGEPKGEVSTEQRAAWE